MKQTLSRPRPSETRLDPVAEVETLNLTIQVFAPPVTFEPLFHIGVKAPTEMGVFSTGLLNRGDSALLWA